MGEAGVGVARHADSLTFMKGNRRQTVAILFKVRGKELKNKKTGGRWRYINFNLTRMEHGREEEGISIIYAIAEEKKHKNGN